MFTISPTEKTGLEEARDQAFLELKNFTVDEDDYTKIMVHIKTLSELIDNEKSEKLSPNTVAMILGNIGIAVMFTIFEKQNVVTTKVIPFLMRSK